MRFRRTSAAPPLLGRFERDGNRADAVDLSFRAVDLGGVNEYARADDAIDPIATSQAWSVLCWFRRDGAIVTPARALWAVNNGSGGSPDNRATIFFDAGATSFSRYQDETGTVAGTRHATTTVTDGEWHMMLVTQTAAGALTIYVDDVLEFTASVTATIATGDILMIGAELDPGFVPGNYWPGDIGGFVVWSSALDAATVAPLLYQAGRGANVRGCFAPAPIVWYSFGGFPSVTETPDLALSAPAADGNNLALADIIQADA